MKGTIAAISLGLGLAFAALMGYALASSLTRHTNPEQTKFKVVQGLTTTDREDYDEFYEITNGKVNNQAISREMLLDRMQQEGWIYQGSHAAPGGFSDGEPAILETYIFKK